MSLSLSSRGGRTRTTFRAGVLWHATQQHSSIGGVMGTTLEKDAERRGVLSGILRTVCRSTLIIREETR